MINAIALDDELLALKIIENYAGKIENLSLKKTFHKQSDALKYLNKFSVDLIFLDIEMPSKNGMDFYKSISQDAKVIFTTAYPEFAVEAFNVNAIDYLVKPFSFERFKNAIDKIENLQRNTEKEYISIRADYKLNKINFQEILFIEGLDDYVKIHLKNNNVITARSSMKNILEKLPQKDFVRVHRSYIIPLKNITKIVNKTINIGEYIIPIGDTYREEIIKLLR